MCVMNKQFELLEVIFYSIYVALQFDEIPLTFNAGSVWLSLVICEVVLVPCVVCAVVALTVMCVK